MKILLILCALGSVSSAMAGTVDVQCGVAIFQKGHSVGQWQNKVTLKEEQAIRLDIGKKAIISPSKAVDPGLRLLVSNSNVGNILVRVEPTEGVKIRNTKALVLVNDSSVTPDLIASGPYSEFTVGYSADEFTNPLRAVGTFTFSFDIEKSLLKKQSYLISCLVHARHSEKL